MEPDMRLNRRDLLRASASAVLGLGGLSRAARAAFAASEDQTVPVRQITRGPKFHWFAYYDKLQFDPTGRYALGMEVDFEHRSPRADDVIKIGMIDLADGDKWTELGQSTAWCWQQGCMLQWRPGSKSEILWNDRQNGQYVCHILDVNTRKKRTIPHPVYSVSPNGRWAVAPDFRRIQDTRPGYGYNGIPDPYKDDLAPKQSGIFHIDLETGQEKLIVSLGDIVKIPFPQGIDPKAKHWFNHLLVNPDGTRFEFLHRWRSEKSWKTRMFTAAPDGSDLHIIDDCGLTSHFIWRDPQHILAWSLYQKPGGFFLFEDSKARKVEPVLMTGDGHCSYLPGNQWIVCDTYPDRQRNQNVYLYHVPTKRQVFIGHFFQPRDYKGEWRCDSHPRFSPDGRSVTIDSPHAGQGRQIYLLDVSRVVG